LCFSLRRRGVHWCPEASSGELIFPTNYGWNDLYVGGEIGGFVSDIDGRFKNPPPATWNSGPTGGIGGGMSAISKISAPWYSELKETISIASTKVVPTGAIPHRLVEPSKFKAIWAKSGPLAPG
jgi:hypothetical protein